MLDSPPDAGVAWNMANLSPGSRVTLEADGTIVRWTAVGHWDAHMVDAAKADVIKALDAAPRGRKKALLIDARGQGPQSQEVATLLRQVSHDLESHACGVAVLTASTLHKMQATRVLSDASGSQKTFPSEQEALAWLAERVESMNDRR